MGGEFSYRDEEGEPLVDFDDDVRSEGEQPHDLLDDIDDAVYDRRERSPTPVYDGSNSKPRKRLIKKSAVKESAPIDFGLDDEDVGDVGGDYGRDDDVTGLVRDDYSDGGKRKRDKGEKLRSLEKNRKAEKEKRFKVRKSGGGRIKDHEADPEMKEMWDTIAGGNSEVITVL